MGSTSDDGGDGGEYLAYCFGRVLVGMDGTLVIRERGDGD